jgi:hypothetical protein
MFHLRKKLFELSRDLGLGRGAERPVAGALPHGRSAVIADGA